MKTKAYVQFEIRNEKGSPVYWGTTPIEDADQKIAAAFKACPVACFVTSRVVEFEDAEASSASASSSFVEATLWSPRGEFVMRVYLPASDYEGRVASLLKSCPSAASVSVREVQ